MKLILTLICFSAAVFAQTFGSIYDPQLATLTVEGRVPLSNILSDNPNSLNIPPQVLSAIQAGALEVRGRVEFNRTTRSFRVYQFVTTPSAPYPSPQSPSLDDPTVAIVFDLSIEHIHWFEYEAAPQGPARRNVTIVGRRLDLLKGTQTLEDEFGVIQLAWDRNDPSRFRLFTVAFAGSLVAASTSPAGSVTLLPLRVAQ